MSQNAQEKPVVLLVEDEVLVRLFNVDVLEEAGYKVIEAVNGDEGVILFESRPDISLIVTDVNMPGSLDGLGFARHVSGRNPPPAVVIVSGRIRPELRDLPPDAAFLAKPYRPADLIEAVAKVIRLHNARRARSQLN